MFNDKSVYEHQQRLATSFLEQATKEKSLIKKMVLIKLYTIAKR